MLMCKRPALQTSSVRVVKYIRAAESKINSLQSSETAAWRTNQEEPVSSQRTLITTSVVLQHCENSGRYWQTQKEFVFMAKHWIVFHFHTQLYSLIDS